jgi:hypothetical protein
MNCLGMYVSFVFEKTNSDHFSVPPKTHKKRERNMSCLCCTEETNVSYNTIYTILVPVLGMRARDLFPAAGHNKIQNGADRILRPSRSLFFLIFSLQFSGRASNTPSVSRQVQSVKSKTAPVAPASRIQIKERRRRI